MACFVTLVGLLMALSPLAWSDSQEDLEAQAIHKQWVEKKIKYLEQPLSIPSITQFFVISSKEATVYVVKADNKIEFSYKASGDVLATLTLLNNAIQVNQHKVEIKKSSIEPIQISENIWVSGFYNNEQDDGRLFLHDIAGKDLDLRRRVVVFPYDSKFRVKAVFKKAEEVKEVRYQTSRNQVTELTRIGRLQFMIGDVSTEIMLDIVSLDYNIINVIFEDQTSGSETYGTRDLFVNIGKLARDLVDGEEIILDFNFAENPMCARSSAFNCPLAQNSIDVAVRAGEKYISK